MAKKWHAFAKRALDNDVWKTIEADLSTFDRLPHGEAVEAAQSRASVLALANFRSQAIAYASWAAFRSPGELNAVQNLGAVLMHNFTLEEDAVSLLRFAEHMDSTHPVVLTNLGHLALDLDSVQRARDYFLRALEVRGNHPGALMGMVLVCFTRKDLNCAMDWLFKLNRMVYVRELADLGDRNENGKLIVPSHPIVAPSSSAPPGASGASTGMHGSFQPLKLPELPRWPGPDAFIFSWESRSKLRSFYEERSFEGLGNLRDHTESIRRAYEAKKKIREGYKMLSREEREAAELQDALTFSYPASHIQNAIELNYLWANKKLDSLGVAYTSIMDGPKIKEIEKKRDGIFDEMLRKIEAACPEDTRSAETLGDALRNLSRMGNCMSKLRTEQELFCKQTSTLRIEYFSLWMDAYHKWYTEAKPILERLYEVQEGWIRLIYDQPQWASARETRDCAVFSRLWTQIKTEEMMRLVFVMDAATSFGVTAELCPSLKMKESGIPDEVSPPELPRGDRVPCPFQDVAGNSVPLEIGLGPVSLKLDCESIHIKAGQGIISRVSHNYRKGVTTFYAGVGVNKNLKIAPHIRAGLNYDIGVYVTIDKNNQIIGYGIDDNLTGKVRAESGNINVPIQSGFLIENSTKKVTDLIRGAARPERPIRWDLIPSGKRE